MNKIELLPDDGLYIFQLIYSFTPIYAGNFYRRSRAVGIWLQQQINNENCVYLHGNFVQILTHHFIQL